MIKKEWIWMNQLNKNKMNTNKLIAEFMGGVMHEGLMSLPNDNNLYNIDCELQYHTSWDWLMPVAEKCLTADEPSDGQHYFINDALLTCNIEVVYDRVVEFIKQYNPYPFNEGDDYWVVEGGKLIWSCWDDTSMEMHDENPNRKYFTEEEAIDYARANGIKYEEMRDKYERLIKAIENE